MALGIAVQNRTPIPKRARTLGRSVRLERFFTHGEQSHPRWQHQSFLSSGKGDVEFPFLEAQVCAPQRAHYIGQEKRRMCCVVHGFTYGRETTGNARGSFSLNDEDSFNSMILVVAKSFLNRIGWHTRTILDFQSLHINPVGSGGAAKLVTEVTVYTTQHLIGR